MHGLQQEPGIRALGLRRRSAFMDYRFGLLKACLPKLACGAFVEAPNESKEKLAALSFILSSADFVASSIEELQEELRRFRLPAGRVI